MKEINASFKTEVVAACVAALRGAGFTEFRKNRVDRPLNEKFHCWVGLNSAIDRKCVEINPFVGVHAVELMKLRASFSGDRARHWKYDRGVATYAIHLGVLLPHENVFRFTRASDLGSEAIRLAHLYATTGLSYAQSIANYASLLPLLLSRADRLGGYPERAAICMSLMGEHAKLCTFVHTFLTKHARYRGAFDDTLMLSLAAECGCVEK